MVGATDLTGEGAEEVRLPSLKELRHAFSATQMARGQKARLILISAEETFDRQLVFSPSQREGIVELTHPSIHQQIVG